MTDRPTCSTCPYWSPDSEKIDGHCRRQPPAEKGWETYGDWPLTSENSWCGEHPSFAAWVRGQGSCDHGGLYAETTGAGSVTNVKVRCQVCRKMVSIAPYELLTPEPSEDRGGEDKPLDAEEARR